MDIVELVGEIFEYEQKIQKTKNPGEVFYLMHEQNKYFAALGKAYFDHLTKDKPSQEFEVCNGKFCTYSSTVGQKIDACKDGCVFKKEKR